MEIHRTLMKYVEQSATELFDAYGVTTNPDDKGTETGDFTAAGVIGFSGSQLRGTLMLAASPSTLQRSLPIPGGNAMEWLPELTNQLLGRITNKLRASGIDIYVTTPLVIRGEHLAPLPRKEHSPFVLRSNDGQVFVWFDEEAAPGTEIKFENATEVKEGQAVLF